ncbi:pentraxin-related protein PTX3 [Synchiropus picturatus]
MARWRIPLAVWSCLCLALAYEDDIEVNYADNYYNEISQGETPEPTPSTTPCRAPDLTKWDKIFSMLENSQMRETMLLQYADDIIKVEMSSVKGEILRFLAEYEGSCGLAVEAAGRRAAAQVEARLRESLPSAGGGTSAVEEMLRELLSTVQSQASRLAKLESSCFSSPGAREGAAPQPAQVGGDELEGLLAALQQTRAELEEARRSSRPRYLPAGCEMALLFPMRSRRIFTSVFPDAPLSLSSFTVCMWVKPNAVSNKTVLLSYGNRRNPYEIQLLLSKASAFLTIGGEAHLVEAAGVVKTSEWMHLCGAWSTQQGLASLWAGGRKVASTPGVAEGHTIPDGGSLQLGQERNGCCAPGSGSRVSGFEGGFDAKLSFAGQMTGVNMWDRALSQNQIGQLARREGEGCQQRGNLVAWGVTEMVPHGGAQFTT